MACLCLPCNPRQGWQDLLCTTCLLRAACHASPRVCERGCSNPAPAIGLAQTSATHSENLLLSSWAAVGRVYAGSGPAWDAGASPPGVVPSGPWKALQARLHAMRLLRSGFKGARPCSHPDCPARLCAPSAAIGPLPPPL